MLKNSFIFLPGIARKGEQNLWQQGIHDWDAFANKTRIEGIGIKSKAFYNSQLRAAENALKDKEYNYFLERLPTSESWRLYPHLKQNACYLDIETCTTGGYITVIGISDGIDCKTLVRGHAFSKEAFLRELDSYDCIITFNGKTFDIPVIEKYFNIKINKPHIDLMHVCARLGLHGGLKVIEQKMGIVRPDEVQGIGGADASRLWDVYLATGDRHYLNLLVKYNEEDILNLKPLAEKMVPELVKTTLKNLR